MYDTFSVMILVDEVNVTELESALTGRLQVNFPILGLGDEAAELQLQKRCREIDVSLDAFSALQYVGTRTRTPPTDFKNLLVTVKAQLRNINVRSPRRPTVVYNALKVEINLLNYRKNKYNTTLN